MEAVVENMLDDVMARKEGRHNNNNGGRKNPGSKMDVSESDYDIGSLKEEENMWLDKGRNRCATQIDSHKRLRTNPYAYTH